MSVKKLRMGIWVVASGQNTRMEVLADDPDDRAEARGIIWELVEARVSDPLPFTYVSTVKFNFTRLEGDEPLGKPQNRYFVALELLPPDHYITLTEDEKERLKRSVANQIRRALRELFSVIDSVEVELFFAFMDDEYLTSELTGDDERADEER